MAATAFGDGLGGLALGLNLGLAPGPIGEGSGTDLEALRDLRLSLT